MEIGILRSNGIGIFRSNGVWISKINCNEDIMNKAIMVARLTFVLGEDKFFIANNRKRVEYEISDRN